MTGRGIRAVMLANSQNEVSVPSVRDPQTAFLMSVYHSTRLVLREGLENKDFVRQDPIFPKTRKMTDCQTMISKPANSVAESLNLATH